MDMGIYIYNYIICTHTYTYTCIYRTHGHIYTYTYRYMYVYVCVCIIFSAIVHQSEFHMNIFTTCFIHAGVRPRSLIRPPRQPGYRTRSVCVQARDACDPKFFSIVGYLDLGSMDVQIPWLLAIHACSQDMGWRRLTACEGTLLRYREGDSGRLFVFQPYYSRRGFGPCRKILPSWVR